MATKKRSKLPVPRFEELPDLATPEQAQAFLQISRNTTYEVIHSREIPSVRFGRLIRIPKAALIGERPS
jgi:excisionase family DNA binding protein